MSTTKLPTLPWYCSHATPVPDAEDLASVHDANGQLVAIMRRDDELWRPHKVLAESI